MRNQSIATPTSKLEAHEELIVFVNGDYVIFDHISQDYFYEWNTDAEDSRHVRRFRVHNMEIKEKHVIYRIKGG